MSSLSPADFGRAVQSLRWYQGAANKMVSGHQFAHAEQNHVSALQLKRDIGVSYNTAWKMKHKLMQVMLDSGEHKEKSLVAALR